MTKENLYEKKLHGDLLFPFQHYTMVTDSCNIFVPYHWHKEIEIILVMEGEVELLLDGNKQLLKKGDIIFVNPETVHGASPMGECIYECIVMRFQVLNALDEEFRKKR